MTNSHLQKLEQAHNIVNAYGKIFADLQQVNAAIPQSLLPYEKSQIKEAIHSLLWELGDSDKDFKIRDSLIHAYVYLEQFIPDDQVLILKRGQSAIESGDPQHMDWECVNEANHIMTQIKIEMENALQDLNLIFKV